MISHGRGLYKSKNCKYQKALRTITETYCHNNNLILCGPQGRPEHVFHESLEGLGVTLLLETEMAYNYNEDLVIR